MFQALAVRRSESDEAYESDYEGKLAVSMPHNKPFWKIVSALVGLLLVSNPAEAFSLIFENNIVPHMGHSWRASIVFLFCLILFNN